MYTQSDKQTTNSKLTSTKRISLSRHFKCAPIDFLFHSVRLQCVFLSTAKHFMRTNRSAIFYQQLLLCVCFFFYYQMRFLLYFIWVVVVLVWFRRENSNHTADSSNGIVFFSLSLNVPVRKSACILPSANVRLSTVLLIWFFIMIMLNYYGDVYKMCINFRWKCNNAIMHNGYRNKSRRLVEHTIVSWDFCAISFFKQEKKNTHKIK